MKSEELSYQLHEVEPYINWLYFFNAWGFPARYGSVAQMHDCPSCHAQWFGSFPESERPRAKEALRLFDDARTLLRQFDCQFQTHALVGLYEANGDGEDILLFMPDEFRLPLLRQQQGETCLCWADFLLPLGAGRRNTVGVFVASTDEGIEQSFPNDGYRHMLSQTLADRLAEATAERMHEDVRKRIWGYAPNERLSIEEMFQERYVGRRPAVGYPSLPDQSLNFLLDQLLRFQRIGVRLTESGAMRPHASTSGLLISHPQASHFAIGPIGNDQLQDYARRRGMSVEQMRRFLAANLLI